MKGHKSSANLFDQVKHIIWCSDRSVFLFTVNSLLDKSLFELEISIGLQEELKIDVITESITFLYLTAATHSQYLDITVEV